MNNTNSNKIINPEKLINYWIETSDKDFDTMNDLYKCNKYHWSLFIGHLVIEKLLKAYYIKKKNVFPPLSHNLLNLSKKAELHLSKENKINFATLTTFNINSRYDDYKLSFYKKCTKEYTTEWIKKIKGLRLWIKKLLS